MSKRLFLILMMFSLSEAAREEEGETVKEGNFALPASQQPAPLFSFGQNIVDAHDIIEYTYTDYQMGKHQKLSDIVPSLLYGVSDKLSLYLNIPIATKFQVCQQKSSGLEDIFIQAEYLFFSRERPRNAFGSTAVATLFFPTGSSTKNPTTGIGNFSFLFGSTLSYTSVESYVFISPFVALNLKKSGTKVGNQFYYQAGIGRNLIGDPDGWLITPMIEFYGIYAQKDRTNGVEDPNSGGNVFYLGPSLWATTKRFTGQAGIVVAATQQLNGQQNKQQCLFEVSLGWKFNA